MKSIILSVLFVSCVGFTDIKNQHAPIYIVKCWSDNTQSYVQKASFTKYEKAVQFKDSQENKDCYIEEYFS